MSFDKEKEGKASSIELSVIYEILNELREVFNLEITN